MDTLLTARLTLEPLVPAHAAELWPGLGDPRLYAYIPRPPPASLDALEQRFARISVRCAPCRTEQWLNWTVRLDTRAIGRVEVTVREDRSAYLAYELIHDAWGRGFAAEACAAVIEHLFAEFPITSVVAEVDVRNARSIALLERLGFRRTGTAGGEHAYALLSGDRASKLP